MTMPTPPKKKNKLKTGVDHLKITPAQARNAGVGGAIGTSAGSIAGTSIGALTGASIALASRGKASKLARVARTQRQADRILSQAPKVGASAKDGVYLGGGIGGALGGAAGATVGLYSARPNKPKDGDGDGQLNEGKLKKQLREPNGQFTAKTTGMTEVPGSGGISKARDGDGDGKLNEGDKRGGAAAGGIGALGGLVAADQGLKARGHHRQARNYTQVGTAFARLAGEHGKDAVNHHKVARAYAGFAEETRTSPDTTHRHKHYADVGESYGEAAHHRADFTRGVNVKSQKAFATAKEAARLRNRNLAIGAGVAAASVGVGTAAGKAVEHLHNRKVSKARDGDGDGHINEDQKRAVTNVVAGAAAAGSIADAAALKAGWAESKATKKQSVHLGRVGPMTPRTAKFAEGLSRARYLAGKGSFPIQLGGAAAGASAALLLSQQNKKKKDDNVHKNIGVDELFAKARARNEEVSKLERETKKGIKVGGVIGGGVGAATGLAMGGPRLAPYGAISGALEGGAIGAGVGAIKASGRKNAEAKFRAKKPKKLKPVV